MMEVMAAKAVTPSFARYRTMIANGPRIDPYKLFTREELEDLLPPSLFQVIIRRAATIDGLLSGRQVGSLIEEVFQEASRGEERSPSMKTHQKKTYLTVAEVGEILSLSSREVTRLVDGGQLCAIDLNEGQGKKKRALRIRGEWIEELEARLITKPEEQPKSKFRLPATRAHQKK